MTTLTETPSTFGGQSIPTVFLDWASGQLVSYSTATQSAAITMPDGGGVVYVCSTTKCWIKAGANPTATVGATSFPVPADCWFPIGIRNGEKISAIQETAAGTLAIMPAVGV
jgi:hypothetical protein